MVVLQVAAGEAHVVALSSSAAGAAGGCVWTWGRGRHGSLGHGDFEDQQTPRQVTHYVCVRMCVIDGCVCI